MDAQRWERIESIFHDAAERPAEERRAYVSSRCADDPSLVDEVLALLEEDARAGSLLDQPLDRLAHDLLDFDPDRAPRRIGPYRLLRVLGEGGMGIVYLAERTDLGNKVAIKLLRDAWLTPARRERFAAEQRTLAQLTHPAIARLYDADTLPDGTPWFAMEHVSGLPITEYCARRACPVPRILELFRAVCEAVLHAHQIAVIHRDLKPSNILVTDDGRVKLLDFGIAKQLDEIESDAHRTQTGWRLMTPAYASPEQIRGGRLGIQTDIYSLGVLLYELLAGRPPFDLSDRTPGEVDRIVSEQAPERPSAAARTASRGDGKRSGRALPAASWADLDVLCLTAMQKDPARRYRTVDSLIRDVDHYLRGEPLEARPDSLGYRAGKFLRRRWRPVAAAAAVLAVVAGMTGYYTARLASARNDALAQAERTRRIQEFMNQLFEGGDETAGPPESLRVVTLVSRGVQEARTLSSEPVVQAELYQTLGSIYHKLGDFAHADSLLGAALAQRRAHLGPEHPDVARSLVALGLLRADQSAFDEAESLVREALAIGRRRAAEEPAATARALTALGLVLENRGGYEKAIEVLTEAVRVGEAARLPAPDVAATLTELANSHFYSGHYAVSDSLNRRVLEIDRRLYGDRHPHVAADLINLGAIRQEMGRYEDAEALYRQALGIYRGWYGDDHYETAASLTMLGRALIFQKRLDEAEGLLRQALAIRERVYGPVHQSVASTVNELGRVAQQRGRLEEAKARFRRMVEIYRAVFADGHYLVGIALSNLGGVYTEQRNYPEAVRHFREALRCYGETLPADHLYVGIAEIRLGRALLRQGRFSDAERTSLDGYRIVAAQTDPSVSWLEQARRDLVEIYEALDQPDRADDFRRELARAPEPSGRP